MAENSTEASVPAESLGAERASEKVLKRKAVELREVVEKAGLGTSYLVWGAAHTVVGVAGIVKGGTGFFEGDAVVAAMGVTAIPLMVLSGVHLREAYGKYKQWKGQKINQ